ncbi:MAG: ribulose-5-phosphate 4-epimerase-like epimerase or aldolase [Evtepia sp.]|jgi:L-fuculose-phosphate aldolase|nr:ribulose-5-phosphate 4-epimerase-like epimerase or aldolase [Evtepia sp.]
MKTPRYWSDQEAKVAILSCGARLYTRGFVAANDGNLSIKVSPNEIWTTPTGVSKGFMTEDMLVKVDTKGAVLEGLCKPSSELKMHLRIYQEAPEVLAVVHAHPPVSTAFAAAGMPLDRPVLQEAVVQLGHVPLAPYALPGSDALADSVAPFCQNARALLLEFHGAVTWGKSMEEAMSRMESLEQYATILLHLKTLGCDRVMPPPLVEDLTALRSSLGL